MCVLTVTVTLPMTRRRARRAAPQTPFTSYDPITNLTSWPRSIVTAAASSTDKTFRLLTLHSLVTPAPLRRRNAPDSILTSIHPSLRSWLAPLIFPRRHHQQHNTDSGHGGDGQQQFQQSTSRQKENWNGNSRRRQIPPAFNAPLNRHNLGQHLDQLLLSHYDASTPDSQESREEEAVDVLEDSSRVAHQVADLLTNFEVQSAGQRKLFDNSTPKSNPKRGLLSQTDA